MSNYFLLQVLWVNEEGLRRASEATKLRGYPVRYFIYLFCNFGNIQTCKLLAVILLNFQQKDIP